MPNENTSLGVSVLGVSLLGVSLRHAEPKDLSAVAGMCHALWPDAPAEEHARDVAPLLAGQPPGSLPAVVLVAETPAGRLVGFLQAGLRSHADGCDPAHPVGFVEGWFVEPEYRGCKIGARLLQEAEAWARAQDCREMASDTWIDNIDSQRVHEALGFEVVDRCVHYRKKL